MRICDTKRQTIRGLFNNSISIDLVSEVLDNQLRYHGVTLTEKYGTSIKYFPAGKLAYHYFNNFEAYLNSQYLSYNIKEDRFRIKTYFKLK